MDNIIYETVHFTGSEHLEQFARKKMNLIFSKIDKERGTNNLVILGQPFFHQTTLFFCE